MRDTLTKIEHKVESQDRRQERQEILDWISKSDYKHHRDIQSGLLHQRQPGTRQWLFESSSWKAWLNARGTSLYCSGMPGAGKTVTTAMVIEKLQQVSAHDVALAYIFCEYQRENKSDLQAVLARSTLRMLLEHLDTIPDEITEIYDKRRDIDVDQVFTLLRVVATHCRATVIIDALDELDLEPRDKLLKQLSRLQHEASINVFLTSREMPEIQRGVAKSFPRLMTIEVKATEDDVLSYLDDSVKLLPNVVQKDATLQEEIRNTIVKSTRGMFLLAHLHINSLKSKRTRKDIQEALRRIGEGRASYQEAYDNAMRRIQGQGQDDRDMAMRVLLVLFFARRPLSAEEICHFVAVDIKASEIEGAFDLDDVLELEEILSTCAGLVNYQTEINQVQFVHQSTKEYLKETEARWFPDGEDTMRDICETYNRRWDAAEATGSGERANYFLLDYTKSLWASHYMAAERSLVEREASAEAVDTKISTSRHGTEQATHYGLRRLARDLVDNESVLRLASSRGQYALVEVVLTANPTMKGSGAVDIALIAAVRGGHAGVVSLLLKNGANFHIRDDGLNLLAIAAQAGSLDTMHLLLGLDGRFMDTLLREVDLPNALELWGDDYIVKAGKPDDLDEADRRVMLWMVSPLSLAAHEGHVHIIRFLLGLMKDGTKLDDKHILSTKYNDAAICAVHGGHLDAFQEILPLVDINMQTKLMFKLGNNYSKLYTPSLFWLACKWGREVVAELMIDKTVSIGVSILGISDFFLAVRNNMLGLVRRMLSRTDTTLLNGPEELTSWTPLHEAVHSRFTDMVSILVQRQDLNMNPKTPEHFKMDINNCVILPRNVSPFIGTPLHVAAIVRDPEAVRLLLEREDIRLDVLDYAGHSALDQAIFSTQYLNLEVKKCLECACGTYYSDSGRYITDAVLTIRYLYEATTMHEQTHGTTDGSSRTTAHYFHKQLLTNFHIPYSQNTKDPVELLISDLEAFDELVKTTNSMMRLRSGTRNMRELDKPSPRVWIFEATLASHHSESEYEGDIPDYILKLN